MQQQTAQIQAEQTQQAKHETAAAVSDYSVSQTGENNNLIMLLMAAVICLTVILTSLTVTMQAAVDASGGQGDNNGTVCTQIVEAAQNELNDADKTVGGYRYKTGMGWMRTGVPCLCHTVQISVASLKGYHAKDCKCRSFKAVVY